MNGSPNRKQLKLGTEVTRSLKMMQVESMVVMFIVVCLERHNKILHLASKVVEDIKKTQ